MMSFIAQCHVNLYCLSLCVSSVQLLADFKDTDITVYDEVSQAFLIIMHILDSRGETEATVQVRADFRLNSELNFL